MPRNPHCCCEGVLCDDGTFSECMTGKCATVTISGVGGGGCCSDVNGTYPMDTLGFGLTSCVAGQTAFNGVFECDDSPQSWSVNLRIEKNDSGTSGLFVYITFPAITTGPDPYRQINYELVGDDADEAINILCAGGTVTLPFTGITGSISIPDGCDGEGGHATVRLIDCPEIVDCSGFDDCEHMSTLTMALTDFENCTILDDGAGHPFLEEWFWTALNGGYALDPADTFSSPPLSCVTQDPRNFFIILGDFTSVTALERYSDAGILYHQDTYAGSQLIEYYVCGIAVETSCEDAEITIGKVSILYHGFVFNWNGSEFDRTTVALYFSPICYDHGPAIDPTGAPAGVCTTRGGTMCSAFDYDQCGSTEQFSACGVIGPVF